MLDNSEKISIIGAQGRCAMLRQKISQFSLSNAAALVLSVAQSIKNKKR